MLDRMGRDEMFYRICHINDVVIEDKDSVLSAIKNITNPDFQDNRGESYLHMACQAHSIEAISLLLKKGANPNITDRFGYPPIFSALGRISDNNPLILEVMLHYGLDLNRVIDGLSVKKHIEMFGNDKLNEIINNWLEK